MKTSIIYLLILTGLGTLCLSCQKNDSPRSRYAEVQPNKCYKKVFPFTDNSEDKDVMELKLQINGDTVKGEYNWLPAYKDQRKGSLKGTINGNLIKADYIFMQEGIQDTAAIKVTLTDTTAIITGKPEQLGLAATLPRIVCS